MPPLSTDITFKCFLDPLPTEHVNEHRIPRAGLCQTYMDNLMYMYSKGAYLIPLGPFRSSRCTTGVIDTGVAP
jgi:hypothetical protein